MSHTAETDSDNDMFDDIDDTDYIFVVGEDGNLKSVLMPGEFENQVTPENVEKILGIFQVNQLYSATLH